MKKYILILISYFLFTNCIYAKTTDVSKAQTVAQNFYNQNSRIQSINISLAYTEKTAVGDTSIFFIFNMNQNDGWVIVSADDATLPILGYSLSGHYNSTNASPEFLIWMNNYKAQILFIKRNKLQPTSDIAGKWQSYENNILRKPSKILSYVNPLLQTTWNQEPYYNSLCPNGAPTGCVATAMAQIMKFWNYPEMGTGSLSYIPQTNPSYGIQTANFGNTKYDWSSMSTSVTSPNNAVATIMYQCGVSVEMDYTPSESGSWVITDGGNHPFSAEHAYSTYFGYNPKTIQGLQKNNYADADWINNILKPELDNGRPIQYGGWDTGKNGGGHSWVCDGYDVNNYFHMNWGWGGYSDCYVTINVMNPNLTNYNFNFSQQVIIGIEPTNNSCVDQFEPNDNQASSTLVFASPLNNIGSNYTLHANIGWAGDQDWYKINIASDGTLTINLSNLPFNYDLELYGPGGLSQWIARSDNSGTNSEQIVFPYTGSSTTVYAKVYPSPNNPEAFTTTTCYNLQFIWNPTTINLPDLYLSSLGMSPPEVYQGGSLKLNSIVNNSGPGNAGASYVGYYLSNSCVLDGSSILLGSSSVEALTAGSSSSQNVNVTIPLNATSGTHYILYVADFQNAVNESNKNNNINCMPITILATTTNLPNLLALSGGVGTNGNVATYQYVIMNNGKENAGPFTIKLYACTSPTFANPVWVGVDNVSQGLAVNATYSSKINVDLCYAGLTSDSYYLGFYIDYDNQVNESNENDNNNFYAFNSFPINCSINCKFSIAPNNFNFIFGGGSGWTSLVCNSSCSWTAYSPDNWIIVLDTVGTGSRNINYEVSENLSPDSRIGHIYIAGQIFTITQNGKNCASSVYPIRDSISNTSGDYSFHIVVGSGCGYSVNSNRTSWLQITKVQGDTLVFYHVTSNSEYPRTGIITVDTASHFVYQTGNLNLNWIQAIQNTGLIHSFVVKGNNIISGGTGGIFLSSDNGFNWINVSNGLPDSLVFSLVSEGNNIFAGTYFNGVYISADNGINWNVVNNRIPNMSVNALAIYGNNIFAGTPLGVYILTIDGQNCDNVSNGLPNAYIEALAINGNNIFAGTPFGVYLSTNSGQNWNAVNNGIQKNYVGVLACDGNNIFAGIDDEVYLSTNNGLNWSSSNNGLPGFDLIYSIVIFNHNIFVGTSGGEVYLSTDNGQNWENVSNGLPNAYIEALAINGNNIFAGTNNAGIWRLPLSEIITNVKEKQYFKPTSFSLEQNYPNPFNPSSKIRYSLPFNSNVKIEVYNILGEKIKELVNEQKNTGYYEVNFNTTGLASGVYFYMIEAKSIDGRSEFRDTKKMVLLK